MARGALSAVSGVANGFFPGSGLLVNHLGSALLNKLGLSEKTVIPEGYGGPAGATALATGGAVVASADAPVAFGRMETPSGYANILHRAANGDIIVHFKEALRDVTTNATANTATSYVDGLYPTSSSFVLAQQIGKMYQDYHYIAMKSHYVHWTPTSTKARICLGAVDSYGYNTTGAPASFVDFSCLEDFACGSAYEDFALEWTPTRSLNWYPCYPSAPAGDDSRLNVQSLHFVRVELNSTTSDIVGTIFLESIVAFKKTRNPDVTVGLMAAVLDPTQFVKLQLDPSEFSRFASMVYAAKLTKNTAMLEDFRRLDGQALVDKIRAWLETTKVQAALRVASDSVPNTLQHNSLASKQYTF